MQLTKSLQFSREKYNQIGGGNSQMGKPKI